MFGAIEGTNVKRLALLLVGVLLLAACGGGFSDATKSATHLAAEAAGTAPSVTSAATPATTATAATPAGTTAAIPPAPSATAAPVVVTAPATQSAPAATMASTVQPTTAVTAEASPTSSEAPTSAATSVPTAASTQVAAAGQPTQDQLTSGLIVASDMPDGWSNVPPDPSADAEPVGFCQPNAASGIDQIRANGAFQQPDQGLYLQETLIGFAPGDSTAWMNWVQPTLNCSQVTDSSASPPVVYQVMALNIPAAGDRMLAYRLSVSDSSLGEIAYDIVYARVGNCVVTIANLALGVANTDLTQSATQAAVNRARPVCGG